MIMIMISIIHLCIGKLSTNRGIQGNTDTHTEYIDKYMFKYMFRACGVSDPQNIFIYHVHVDVHVDVNVIGVKVIMIMMDDHRTVMTVE